MVYNDLAKDFDTGGEFEMPIQNRRKKRKQKNSTMTVMTLILIVITVPFLFNAVNFFIQKLKLESQKNNLIELIDQEEAKKQQYLQELSRVGSSEYNEYLARKYLGYIYPDENVLIVTDTTDDSGQ